MGQVEKEWWDKWILQVWPTMFSYKKWKTERKNVQKNELVLLKYPGPFKDDYTIARVINVLPGSDGLFRRVRLGYRKKNSKEPPHVCKSKPLIEEEVAVHRNHRLQLLDEHVCTVDEQAEIVEDL